MSTKTKKSTKGWVSNTGRTHCEDHAPQASRYLKWEIEANPNAVCHITPLDVWFLIDGLAVNCETCEEIREEIREAKRAKKRARAAQRAARDQGVLA